jgi:hypothetical protein
MRPTKPQWIARSVSFVSTRRSMASISSCSLAGWSSSRSMTTSHRQSSTASMVPIFKSGALRVRSRASLAPRLLARLYPRYARPLVYTAHLRPSCGAHDVRNNRLTAPAAHATSCMGFPRSKPWRHHHAALACRGAVTMEYGELRAMVTRGSGALAVGCISTAVRLIDALLEKES